MRISIALCTFNGEKYLPAQLDSIRAQTLAPFELVVRDDGSTDRTLAILEAFAREATYPVRIAVNEKNLHFTGNFMRAASECTGDCIAFCDQDDLWESTKLEEIAAAVAREPAELYLHEAIVIDGEGRPTGAKMPDHARLRADPDSPPYGEGAKGFAMAVMRSVIDEMLRDWDWDCYHAFRARLGSPSGHDQLLYAWCLDRRITLIGKTLARYRVHESNVTASQTMTGNWLTRLARTARLIQFTEFNYGRMGTKWKAEGAFVRHMFPQPPRGIRKLADYFEEIGALWSARAAVHDLQAPRLQRWRALRQLRRLNRDVRLAGRFGRAALAKDMVLTLLQGARTG